MNKIKIMLWLPVFLMMIHSAHADVMSRSAMDPNAAGYSESLSMADGGGMASKWEPAKLPPHVIPAVKVIDVPRNQKIRMTSEMYTVQPKVQKLHAPVAVKVFKIHPKPIKTVDKIQTVKTVNTTTAQNFPKE